MEAFALFCLLQDSPKRAVGHIAELSYNQKQVATNGRMSELPRLKLRCHDRQYALCSWAMHIMAQLEPVCEALDLDQEDHPDHPYRRALAHQKQLITHHTLTPSAQLLAEIQAAGESFSSYTLRKSKEHQATLIRMRAEKMALFERVAKKSIEKQRNMEDREDVSFESFLPNSL
jgi:glutamate--cysteine ligase